MKQHPGYPDLWLTADGRVFRELKQSTNAKGYHEVGRGHLKLLVHRLMLEAFRGLCPPWHEARHLDGVPGHNDISNLAWGTRSENRQDREAHRRVNGGGGRVLDAETVLDIDKRLRQGETPTDIARHYGVTKSTISNIRYGGSWAWLTNRTR